jgi:hypothetical protein
VRQNGKKKRAEEHADKLLKFTGNPETIDDAVQLLVGKVLQGISVAPTDLDGLRQRLSISDCHAEDIPFSGELRRKGKERTIVYSVHLSRDRRRFTIAHEMGHVLLEMAGLPLPHSGTAIERLCDKFAAEILMPKSVFLDRLGDAVTINRLFDLKRTFQVSLVAIGYRCFDFQRVSAFEVENGRVAWGVGLVKKGSLHLVEPGLRLVIDKAEESETGNHELFFVDKRNTYRGELEWSRQSFGRTLFILRRCHDQKLSVTAPRNWP